MIYVVSGPSGCGKSTLIRRVLADLKDIRFSVSHTTRPKRKSEVQGKDYYFVGQDEFQKMVKRKEFVEWATVHGYFYGTSKREMKKAAGGDLILDIDIQGARQVKEAINRAVFIFILPPLYEELKKRLEQRGQDSPAAISQRLTRARQEIRAYPRFDYLVVNDDLEKAVGELKSIILCQRCRLAARKEEIRPILESFGKDK